MSPLLKIRSERDHMSAIERRIADFLLDNAYLLRDYSSQQLASALGISQSSVVKFSQKLGFKGYPDLKYSVGESLARGDGGDDNGAPASTESPHPHAALAEGLWRAKAEAEEETRLINPPANIDAIADAIRGAQQVFVNGLALDGTSDPPLEIKVARPGYLSLHPCIPVLSLAPGSPTPRHATPR